MWVAQSCPTLCDPVDCSPPGSSVHGILQARILELNTARFKSCLLWWLACVVLEKLPNYSASVSLLVSTYNTIHLEKSFWSLQKIDASLTCSRNVPIGTCLVVHWLRFHASSAEAWVRSLVGKLRFLMSCGTAKKRKKLKIKEMCLLLSIIPIPPAWGCSISRNTAPGWPWHWEASL